MFNKKPKIQLKELLEGLEKTEDAKGKVMQIINRSSGASPFDPFGSSIATWARTASQSISPSVSGTPSFSPSPSEPYVEHIDAQTSVIVGAGSWMDESGRRAFFMHNATHRNRLGNLVEGTGRGGAGGLVNGNSTGRK